MKSFTKNAIIAALFVVSPLMHTSEGMVPNNEKKSGYIGDACKATVLSGLSAFGAWFYYETIVKPYIINMACNDGIAKMIKFNKDFVVGYPRAALLYATPLIASAFFATVARDYVAKVWKKTHRNS